jgi:hypothetical protein
MSVPADYTGLMHWLASLEAEFIQGQVFFMKWRRQSQRLRVRTFSRAALKLQP